MHLKTNETNKNLLESVGFVAKLATKKRTVGLKTHLKGSSTATARNLQRYQNLSGQVKKAKVGTMLYIDMHL